MRRFFANAALMAVSLLVSLAGIEAAARVYGGERIFAAPNYVNRTLDIVRATLGFLQHDATLGWVMRENHHSIDHSFSTGPMGVRSNGGELRALPRRAIIAVGDSFTVGSGVANHETWPAQLEAAIGRSIVNGGVGAYGVDQIVLRAERLAETIEPEAIIVGVLTQDSLRNAYRVFGGGHKPWFEVVGGEPVLRGVPVPRVDGVPLEMDWARRVFGHSFAIHYFMMNTGRARTWIDDSSRYQRVMSNEAGVEVSCALMRRLEALRARHGTRIIVFMMWGAQEAAVEPPPWYGPPVIKCALEAGFEALDLYPELNRLAKDPADYARYWLNEGGVLGHPSALGHALTTRLRKDSFFLR